MHSLVLVDVWPSTLLYVDRLLSTHRRLLPTGSGDGSQGTAGGKILGTQGLLGQDLGTGV